MREVPGYDGKVFITEDGSRVVSFLRHKAGKTLTRSFAGRGRARVKLASKSFYVHELVAMTFIGPRPDGMQIRHLDDDFTNNHWTNLAYGTAKENCADSVASGKHVSLMWKSRTHCPQGHEYTPENTYAFTNKGGGLSRQCKECTRTRNRERKRRQRATSNHGDT